MRLKSSEDISIATRDRLHALGISCRLGPPGGTEALAPRALFAAAPPYEA
jgi:hypothetical protein